MVQGAGGEKQFSDRAVRDPVIVELRGKVVPLVDPSIKPEQVDLSIELNDGRALKKRIAHAIGSLETPMSDADLERKFADLAEGILAPQQASKVIGMCWKLEDLSKVSDIVEAGSKSIL